MRLDSIREPGCIQGNMISTFMGSFLNFLKDPSAKHALLLHRLDGENASKQLTSRAASLVKLFTYQGINASLLVWFT